MSRRAAALLLLGPGLAAAADADWLRCRTITEDAARLACYDRQAAPQQVFGAEQLPPEAAQQDADARLHSRVLGELQGWDAKTVFTLENGQVWQNIGDRSAYFRLSNPAVTLEKGLFGSYWLQLDDLQLRTRVKRIR